MYRMMSCLALLVPLVSTATFAESPASSLQWQVNVACAAGYQANWQNRMSIRAESMSNGIQLQAEDYKAAATRHYQNEEKVSLEDAKRRIDAYIADNVARFIDMDKAGTLEAFLDSCPEIELETPK